MSQDSPEWISDGMEVGQVLLSSKDPEFVNKFIQGSRFHDSVVLDITASEEDRELIITLDYPSKWGSMTYPETGEVFEGHHFTVDLMFFGISKLDIARPKVMKLTCLMGASVSRRGSEFEFIFEFPIKEEYVKLSCNEFYLLLAGAPRKDLVRTYFHRWEGYEDIGGPIRWE